MAPDDKGPSAGQFQLTRLPWWVGGGGLLLYLVTLNHWISLQSLGMVARVSGWLWEPQVGRPLTVALFFPFRVLPETWIPLTLNLFTAVCAGLILMLLARSVALLRQDLGPDPPPGKEPTTLLLTGPGAWMPTVLAAFLCGLQLSFWEQATSASGEMVDLLVFSYVIRCLLEFRLSQQDRWFWKGACIMGAAMANHWLMIAYFPVFLIALARVKGLGQFLERGFLLRLTLWLVAGLSLYLLLPLTQGWVGFWPTLHANLEGQAEALSALRRPALRLVALTSLLPLLVIAVRWKSHSVQLADDSRLGVFVIRATGHLVHMVFLLLPVWLALDPNFSPRHVGAGTSFLPLYYLSALVFGQCAGYLLLFKGRAGMAARAVNWTLLCALPLLLLGRNTGQIKLTNGPWLRQFAKDMHADLPAGESVVLADDAKQLLLLRAELSPHSRDKAPLLVETSSLLSPAYQRFMAERFKNRWSSAVTDMTEKSTPAVIASEFARREPVFWLGSGFGPLFERFTGRPKGCLWQLAARKQGDPLRPPKTDLLGNGQIWAQRWTNHLQGMAARAQFSRPEQPSSDSLPGVLRLEREHNVTIRWLADFYSRALNTWGVELRRSGRLDEGEVWFERCLQLKPANLSAIVTLEYSRQCRRGDTSRLKPEAVQKLVPELFNKNTNWRQNIQVNGPVDEPTFLFRTGRMLNSAGLLRQSAAEFARSAELVPDWVMPRLWLAQTGVDLRDFAGALKLAQTIEASNLPGDGPGLALLLDCQASALWGLGRTNDAVAVVDTFVQRFATNREVVLAGAGWFETAGMLERDLALLNTLLALEPDHPDLLIRIARAQLQRSEFHDAIATLDKVLALAPTDEDARLYRARALLGAERIEEARADYEWLLKKKPGLPNALFGMGTIAWRQQQTNQAITFYRRYLSNAVPGSAQYAAAADRLKRLGEASKTSPPHPEQAH